jgi:hypothetical protein
MSPCIIGRKKNSKCTYIRGGETGFASDCNLPMRTCARENLAWIDDLMGMLGRVKLDLAEWTEGKARSGNSLCLQPQ